MIRYVIILLIFSLMIFAETNATKVIFKEVSINDFPNIKKSMDQMNRLSERENKIKLKLEEAKRNYEKAISSEFLIKPRLLIDVDEIDTEKKECYKTYFHLQKIEKSWKKLEDPLLIHELAKYFFEECKVIRLDLLHKMEQKHEENNSTI